MESPLQACASVRGRVAGVRGSCRRVRQDADRADVNGGESEDASKRRQVDSGAGVATCPLMQERKKLAKF